MKAAGFILSLFFSSIILFSCEKSPSGPEDNTPPGRRDYTWTADTLPTQSNRIQCIWGSSPTDVWAGGAGGTNSNERLWHFNGYHWRTYDQYIPVNPSTIFGFAQNDVWLGGNDGQIFHFDGSNWSQSYQYWGDTVYTTMVTNICGLSPDNIYAVGIIIYRITDQPKGFILHYDGLTWKPEYISPEFVQYLELNLDGNDVYIHGFANQTDSTSETLSFYKLENNIPQKIFQKTTNEIIWATPCRLGEHIYFLIGKNITAYNAGGFRSLLTFDVDKFNYYVSGRSLKDMFLNKRDGLAHYNGDNIEYLYHYSNEFTSNFHKPLILENYVFFTLKDNINDYNIILQGRLE